MMPTSLVLAMMLIPMSLDGSQGSADVEQEKAAIVQAVLDYAEGYYGGEPSRMARGVSPYLSKRGLMSRPGAPTFLVQMNADTLIDASNGAKLAAADRHITTEVLDVTNDVASARVFTAQFNDYLHLIKRGGRWQILNVLWHAPPASTSAGSNPAGAVEQTVRAFAGALFAADKQGLLSIVHPLANLRSFVHPPQERPRVVREQNPETLAVGLGAGQIKFVGTVKDSRITVESIDADIAAAKLTMGPTTVYLHLALQDGTWRVVNTLFYPPSARSGTSSRLEEELATMCILPEKQEES